MWEKTYLKTPKRCHICRKEFSYYLSSPYFCPSCDVKRRKKIGETLKRFARELKEKEISERGEYECKR